MSDNTTEATDHLPSGVESGNPSMEDILASIRRIIADDDAQTGENSDINPLESNLDMLASPPPDSDDLGSLILDAEPEFGDDAVLDLEDILVLDEDDFGEDTLEIPDLDMLEETLSEAQETPAIETITLEGDDSLIDIDRMLESSFSEMDLDISSASDTLEDTAPFAMDMPLDALSLDAVETPTEHETFTDNLIEDTLSAVEASEAEEPMDMALGEMAPNEMAVSDEALSDDIFSALDMDLDLVLDDGLNPTAVEPEDNSAADMAALLSAIDQNIQEIETPDFLDADILTPEVETPAIGHIEIQSREIHNIEIQNKESDREQAAIDIEALLDGDDTSMDPLDDLLSSFLTDDDDDTGPLDLTMDNISQPEITNIADDTDIELVKSLMADLTDETILSEPTTQDALITPEIALVRPSSPVTNPVVDLMPERHAVDDVLDEIFELAMEDETDDLEIDDLETHGEDTRDTDIENMDAGISSLLKIAAEAEHDARSTESIAEPFPEIMPEVLDVMPSQDETLHADLAATEQEVEAGDIDSLFSDSLISAVEASAPLNIIEPETIEPQIVRPSVTLKPLTTLEPDTPVMPSLAIEALAAQSFSFDDLMDTEDLNTEEQHTEALNATEIGIGETREVSDAIDAITTPDTARVTETHPAPSVDEAILPEPDVAEVQTLAPAPLTLPDLKPTAKVPSQKEAPKDTLVAQAAPTVEANPTIDIAPPATQSGEAKTPEKETPDMTKAAVSESILDEVTESATTGAFASLTDMVEAKTDFEESGPRIGDLVQEALRPMLKEWLDENLKGIVERAIQKEVKRISSGG